jgi:hypothetical protein
MTMKTRTGTVSIGLIEHTADEGGEDDITNAEEALPTTDLITTDPVITTVATEALIEEAYEEVTVEDVEDDKTIAKRNAIYAISQATGLLYILPRNVERHTANSKNKLSIQHTMRSQSSTTRHFSVNIRGWMDWRTRTRRLSYLQKCRSMRIYTRVT